MPSFHATLKVDGKEFEVLNCVFSFGQNTDEKNRPSSDVRKGHIAVDIIATDDETILGWMIDPYQKKNGSIIFEKIDQASTLKELKFTDGYCVSYTEHFNYNSTEPMTISIGISPRVIQVGNAKHEDKWT